MHVYYPTVTMAENEPETGSTKAKVAHTLFCCYSRHVHQTRYNTPSVSVFHKSLNITSKKLNSISALAWHVAESAHAHILDYSHHSEN